MFIRSTSPIRDHDGGAILDSIAVLVESMELSNLKQWLLIRGKSVRNPVLLFLHGGPGVASISYARTYMSKLDDL